MNKFLAKTLQGDRVVWTIFLFLFIISVVEMFSASSMLVHWSGSVQGPILRHVVFFVVGLSLAFLLLYLLFYIAAFEPLFPFGVFIFVAYALAHYVYSQFILAEVGIFEHSRYNLLAHLAVYLGRFTA